MSWLIALLSPLVLVAGVVAAQEDPLRRWRWENRVLVITAPERQDAAFQAQRDVLAADPAGLADRDMVIVEIVGDAALTREGEALDTAGLRARLDLDPEVFAVRLVGKDGGVKLRDDRPVALERLFGLIDAMPMRRREMREKG